MCRLPYAMLPILIFILLSAAASGYDYARCSSPFVCFMLSLRRILMPPLATISLAADDAASHYACWYFCLVSAYAMICHYLRLFFDANDRIVSALLTADARCCCATARRFSSDAFTPWATPSLRHIDFSFLFISSPFSCRHFPLRLHWFSTLAFIFFFCHHTPCFSADLLLMMLILLITPLIRLLLIFRFSLYCFRFSFHSFDDITLITDFFILFSLLALFASPMLDILRFFWWYFLLSSSFLRWLLFFITMMFAAIRQLSSAAFISFSIGCRRFLPFPLIFAFAYLISFAIFFSLFFSLSIFRHDTRY